MTVNWCPKHGSAEMTTGGGCMLCAAERAYPMQQHCGVCGWQGPATAGHFCNPKCDHVAALRLPPCHIGGATLSLRQCRDCKLIGIEALGETLWMSAPDLKTKGTL